MKRLALVGWCVAAMATVAIADANTWYVDDNNYNENYANAAAYIAAGYDGTSPEKAFGTIQAVMDYSGLVAGDTVILLPGTYDKGSGTITGGQGMAARVVVKKANVTIRSSTGKAADVHIVGNMDTSAENDHGMGPSSMRCIADTGVTGIVVQGVTIRNGSTVLTILKDGNPDGRGGGVYSSAHGRITIIDCVVSNCVAKRSGGAHQVVAHSSLFTGNYAGSVTMGSGIGYSSAANCLIVHNSTDSQYPLAYMYNVVNCTIARNLAANASKGGLNNGSTSSQRLCNVLAFDNRQNGASDADAYSCVFSGTPGLKSRDDATVTNVVQSAACVAPVLGDWRPLSTGCCANRGRGEYLLYVPLPQGYTYHDMAGNAVATNGPITVGAFQETVTPVAAKIVFDSTRYAVEGADRALRSDDWINPSVWPCAYRIKSTRDKAFSIRVSGELDAGSQYNFQRHAGYDGWATYVPPPDPSQTVTMSSLAYDDAFYADAVNGSDDFDGSSPTPAGGGSLVGPKKTLQAAVDLATNGFSIVYAAPGVYDEGGMFYNGLSNRVCLIDRVVGLIASEGPGTATIVGAPDPGTGGLGPNAMRCVYLGYRNAFVQGFNLTGGHTVDSGTGNNARGAA